MIKTLSEKRWLAGNFDAIGVVRAPSPAHHPRLNIDTRSIAIARRWSEWGGEIEAYRAVSGRQWYRVTFLGDRARRLVEELEPEVLTTRSKLQKAKEIYRLLDDRSSRHYELIDAVAALNAKQYRSDESRFYQTAAYWAGRFEGDGLIQAFGPAQDYLVKLYLGCSDQSAVRLLLERHGGMRWIRGQEEVGWQANTKDELVNLLYMIMPYFISYWDEAATLATWLAEYPTSPKAYYKWTELMDILGN